MGNWSFISARNGIFKRFRGLKIRNFLFGAHHGVTLVSNQYIDPSYFKSVAQPLAWFAKINKFFTPHLGYTKMMIRVKISTNKAINLILHMIQEKSLPFLISWALGRRVRIVIDLQSYFSLLIDILDGSWSFPDLFWPFSGRFLVGSGGFLVGSAGFLLGSGRFWSVLVGSCFSNYLHIRMYNFS